jgi:hypothetical protein
MAEENNKKDVRTNCTASNMENKLISNSGSYINIYIQEQTIKRKD